ncbi:MAG: hypothetical protein NTZ83_03485 [Candidatus Pacearchaeota archaeon]|nr:hypothetical protein [Candidatus Pacearchaeota archaeon]
MGIETKFDQEIDKKVDEEMLKGWAPERFAKELYSNPNLPNESKVIIQSYLSDKPRLRAKVETYKEEYQKLKNQNS